MNAKSCRDYDEAISALVDGHIEAADRAEVEAHLRQCVACRTLAGDLQRIRDGAADLPLATPPFTLWPRISSRLKSAGVCEAAPRDEARTVSPLASPPIEHESRGWLGAFGGWLTASPLRTASLAAAALVVLAVGTALVVYRPAPISGPASGTTARTGSSAASTSAGGAVGTGGQPSAANAELAESVADELRLAATHYEKALPGLEQIAKAGQASLEPAVADALQKNLSIIDSAIADIKALLVGEPDNLTLLQKLIEAFRSKVAFLQDAVALVNEMRKGNQAEAARIIQKVNQS